MSPALLRGLGRNDWRCFLTRARKRLQRSEASVLPAGEGELRARSGLEAGLFFLFVFVVYIVSPVVISSDSRFVIPTDLSILRHGDANIDEYRHRFVEAPWAIRTENGHDWNVYPVGVSFLSLPWVWLIDESKQLQGFDFEAEALRGPPLFEELLVASFFTAVAAALLFLVVRKRLTLPRTLLLASAFAFGTPAYSSASRGLVQHGPALMLLAAAVLLLQRLADSGSFGALALGAVAGFSYSVRPSNLIVIIGFAFLIAVKFRARLASYVLGVVVGILPMAVFNKICFGTWTSYYYRLIQGSVHPGLPPIKPALAVLISPSRGLFVFSPFLVFVLARLGPRFLRDRKSSLLEVVLGASCIVWWIGVSKFPWWWGGGSYGPRLLSEAALLLVILLIPLVEEMSLVESLRRRLLTVAFVVTLTVSVAIHFRAATFWPVWEWNNFPISVDQSPERVWDWRDPQFLRGYGK